MMAGLGRVFRAIASSVLEMDDTVVPYQQLEILNDFLAKQQFTLNASNVGKLLKGLKRKHLVDSITVLSSAGQMVVSSEGNGNTASAVPSLLSYIDSELATPKSVLIQGCNGWFMLFPFNGKTYVVKAQAALSNIELKALAKELESFVSKNGRVKTPGKAVSLHKQ
jgi:hypothetical protein